jgi:hypothetical protein
VAKTLLLLFYFYFCGISAWHHHPFIQSTHGHGYQSPLLFFLLDKVNVQQVSFNLAIFLRTKQEGGWKQEDAGHHDGRPENTRLCDAPFIILHGGRPH